ncbi:MAG: xanthan lyase, partial [Bacteroidaceae bacterium]|nr:xanthan lyase [Bacteroidaceae bacterium]
IARGLDGETPTTSGMPRYLEGARYSMQWAGMPYEVYSSRQGTNDYPDDINARPYAINYLSGGSVYNPGLEGQKVPFELSLAVHSDAGFRKDDQLIGTLGIYTLQNEGIDVFNTGVSRYTSRNATELALQEVQNEIRTAVPEWPRRRLVNDNYSETRNPEFPSFIVETLSHQNFSDLHYGQDPYFKFLLARGIYKAVLKYVNLMHGTNEVVQPLPVRSFAIAQPNLRESAVTLSWKPTADKRSPSSAPTGYILYTRKGDADFDNGMYIGNGKTSISVLLDTDEMYDFKVTAVNDGGESMDSEVLSAYISSKSLSSKKKSTMLIVNAFTRLCGPAEVNNDSLQGFDIKAEYGVPYKMFPGFSGEQTCFTKSTIGKETEDGLGFSNREMNGKIVTGNTFDYPHTHGKAVAELKGWSFVSCSKEAFEEMGSTSGYNIIDIIGGLQKEDWSLTSKPLFSEGMKNQLKTFLNKGGKVLLTGAYIASGLTNNADSIFASRWLKYCDGERTSDSIPVVIRQDKMSYEIYTDANKYCYAVQHPSGLIGVNGSIPLADFDGQDICATVAYGRGKYRVVCSSVPLECIKDEKLRNKTMEQYIKFLAK